MGHHPNQLLVGLLLLLDELAGELLQQHEAARKTPVEEAGRRGAVAGQAREAQGAGLLLGQVGQGRAPGFGQVGGAQARQGRAGQAEEPLGGGIGAFDAAVEVEQQNTGRRGVDEALEQGAFFVLAHALAAQGINHLVVHADELVHLALADGHELQREVAGLHGSRARRNQLQGPHEAPVQLRRQPQAHQQQHFAADEQGRVGGAQLGRQRNEHGVEHAHEQQKFETKGHKGKASEYREISFRGERSEQFGGTKLQRQ